MRLFRKPKPSPAPSGLWEDEGTFIPLEELLMNVPPWRGPLRIGADGTFPNGGACVWCVAAGTGATVRPEIDVAMPTYTRVSEMGILDPRLRAIIAPVFAPASQASVALIAAQIHVAPRLVIAKRWNAGWPHESFIGGNPADWPGSGAVAAALGDIDGPAHNLAMIFVQLHRRTEG